MFSLPSCRSALLSFLFSVLYIVSSAQQRQDFNLVELSRVGFDEENSDIWGYEDENGIEYAILGTQRATAIFSLENPAEPILRAYIEGDQSIWRDIKSYQDHIYVTADQGNDGILSIDMSQAPETITHTYTNPFVNSDVQPGSIQTCHNLYIDRLGYIYLSGCNPNAGGLIILEPFTNPDSPRVVSVADARYSHDVYVQDNIAYSSDINDGYFSVIDVTDKENPVTITTQTTTRDFTHNAWASDDGNFLFTTDERGNAFVDAYDISDFGDITRLDSWRPRATEGLGVIPHNVHYFDGYLVTSYYTDGLKIIDASRPHNMVEVGSFDTWLGADGGFEGCWGAYPFLRSGLILASDITEGLIVLQPNYTRAAWLEGTVVDATDDSAIPGAVVNLMTDIDVLELTSSSGEFEMGTALSGSLPLRVQHPAYELWEGEVNMINGEVTNVNIELTPKAVYTISGRVVDADNAEPIENAEVILTTDGFDFEFTTDAQGEFTQEIFAGTGSGVAGIWGYQEDFRSELIFDQDQEIVFELNRGYKDDFFFDFDWFSDGRASSGFWVKGDPVGTFRQGRIANIDVDLDFDLGDELYMTGNGGGSAFTDDVDGGEVLLESPFMDWTQFVDPELRYWAYFYNEGGNEDPNDSLWISISNQDTSIILEVITDTRDSLELSLFTGLGDLLELTDSMKVTFTTADRSNSGNLVEAAIDGFFVGDMLITSIDENPHVGDDITWTIFPNPFAERLQLTIPEEVYSGNLMLFNPQREIVLRRELYAGQHEIALPNLTPGVYYADFVVTNGEKLRSKTLIKAR